MEKEIKRLEKQIELLFNQYRSATSFEEALVILDPLCELNDYHFYLTEKPYISERKIVSVNPYYYVRTNYRVNSMLQQYVSNFIHYKDFHNQFSREIVGEYADAFYQSIHSITKENFQQYSASFLKDVLEDYFFSCDSEGLNLYKELQNDNRIASLLSSFYIQNLDSELGKSYFDLYNHKSFVNILSYTDDLYSLETIVHEIGHVEDFADVSTIDYFFKSIYMEVHSLYREKKFEQYLMQHGNEREVLKMKSIRLEETYQNVYALSLLSHLPNHFFKKNKYNQITQKQIESLFDTSMLDEKLSLELYFQELNLFQILLFSYGDILSSYFIEDPESYSYFRKKRKDYFDPKLLQELGITSESVTRILKKESENAIWKH